MSSAAQSQPGMRDVNTRKVHTMSRSSRSRSARSAVTGRYVTAATAARHPRTTITENRSCGR